MKFTLNARENVVDPRIDPVANLVLSAAAEYEPGDAEVIIAKAKERLARIESNGLRVCRHENGALRGFVLTSLRFNLHTIGQHIDRHHGVSSGTDYTLDPFMIDKFPGDPGYYVSYDYYGEGTSLEALGHGFTEADLGSVFFIAEAANAYINMPGHNNRIPGSICGGMRWGSAKRNAKFNAFCAKFQAAGEGRAVNYLSHSLIYMHDLNRNLFDDTLGVYGRIDYIQQKYSNTRDRCPNGFVRDGSPKWNAGIADAEWDWAAVLAVR